MKKLLLLMAFFPLLMQAQNIDLGGRWNFRIDSLDVGVVQNWQNSSFTEDIKLPGSMTTNNKGNDITVDTKWTSWVADSAWFNKPMYEKYRQPGNVKVIFWLQPVKEYVGPAWYSREFTVPGYMQDKELILNLEQVHWESIVWIDGIEIGMQNSLSTAHVYSLGVLKPGRHRISVRVDNRIKVNVGINAHSVADHTQTNWNGIAGDMFIAAKPKTRITNVAIYPDNDKKQVRAVVKFNNTSGKAVNTALTLSAESKFTPSLHSVASLSKNIRIEAGRSSVEIIYPMGDKFFMWSEHTPYLYRMTAKLESEQGNDEFTTTYGMRKLTTIGRQFAINDKPVFLRGTLDCATFPRTGYPPTDVAEWRRIFTVIKSHGLNHVRYHSWCPPKAAFEAADQLGVFLQVEGASWTEVVGQGTTFDKYIYDETDRILEQYGNHPSFILYTYGNEPAGEDEMRNFLNDFVGHYRKYDPRHKYTSGAGWPVNPNNEYNNDGYPRIYRWFEGLESYINKHKPSTSYDWYEITDQYKVPYVSHEIGDWCVYPNFKEIDKYEGGAVRAKNFEVFREMLEENGMADMGEQFLMASGKQQTICWKAEIEAALRTPDFAGFQMLSLSDFPGQGTALVGVLDAFWEEKGYTAPEEYKRFAGQTVPLARMKQLIFSNKDNLEASIEVAHFGKDPLIGVTPSWVLSKSGGEIVAHGNLKKTDIPIGNCIPLGSISYPLNSIKEPLQMKLTVNIKDKSNDWDIWVYPAIEHKIASNIMVSDTLDAKTVKFMENGGNVLFTPKMGSIKEGKGGEITLGFSSIFWNTGWTVHLQPPYAFGILVDPSHPALKLFPTEYHQNYQWWDAMLNGNAIKLDELDKNLQPVVRIIDDWFQNYSLGLITEAKVGKGKIVICGVDLLRDQANRLEARQLQHSLTSYMNSADFNPAVTLTADRIRSIIK